MDTLSHMDMLLTGYYYYLDPTTYGVKYSYSMAVYVKPGLGVIKVR